MLSPDHILRTGFGFCASTALLSAIEIGVFTELGKGPRSGRQLWSALRLSERTTLDLLDALVALGFLERDGEDARAVYLNTRESGRFLDRNSPAYLGDLLQKTHRHLYRDWGELTAALRSGRAMANGEPVEAATPHILTASLRALVERFDFSGYETLAEVGYNAGALARELTARQATLKCTIHADVEGLPRANVIAMVDVLRRCDPERRRSLIASAHEALSAGGCLIAVEQVIDDERRDDAFNLLMALNARLRPGGADLTAAGFRDFCADAGFERTEVLPLLWPLSAAVACKGR